MTITEAGLSDDVLDLLERCLGRSPSEIRWYETPSNILYRQDMNILLRWRNLNFPLKSEKVNQMSRLKMHLIKIWMQLWILLMTLFVGVSGFDCRHHGCSQDFVFPSK